MLLPHGAVIALIDAHDFRLYRNAGNEAAPRLEQLPTPPLDTHGHAHSNEHGFHHADRGDARPTIAVVEEHSHAIAAVEWLNREALAHRIVALVMIASPRHIGEMRKHYSKALEHALLREVTKELVDATPEEILTALKPRLMPGW